MATKQVCAVLLFLPMLVLCAGRDSKCRTPNGEAATCIPFNSCKVLRDALQTKNTTAINFARESQCGYDSEPLVCCGTIWYKSPRGSSCTTPDGERSSCGALSACKQLSDRIKNRDKAAIEYARRSQCGYDEEPLVCCGAEKTASIASRLFPDRSVCGFEREDDRVYGGQLTDLDEHPWMALLGYKNTDGSFAGFKCGGTLINSRYVLTAAHCVIINTNQGFDLDYVRLGEWNVSTQFDCNRLANDECNDPVVDLKIESSAVHKDYSRRQGKHDIALLRLQRNVQFTDFVRPICLLPPGASDPDEGARLTVAGWGSTENSSFSEVKLRVEIPIRARSVCTAKIRQRGPTTEDQLCAGGEQGKDSCLGDSGGPLMGKFSSHLNSKEHWYQEGIISYGVVCGLQGFPAVYTRVSRYINWMIQNMTPF